MPRKREPVPWVWVPGDDLRHTFQAYASGLEPDISIERATFPITGGLLRWDPAEATVWYVRCADLWGKHGNETETELLERKALALPPAMKRAYLRSVGLS